MKLESGHDVVSFDADEMRNLNKDWGAFTEGLVRLIPGRWIFPMKFKMFANKIYKFEFRSSDVVVMTYPKCGTTWVQEIVWTMRNNPDFDHSSAQKHIFARSPFLDLDMIMPAPKSDTPPPNNPFFNAFLEMCPGKNLADGINLQLAEMIPDSRTIKTQMPFSLVSPSLLDNTKVVYVARNPKDLIISYHHHCRIEDILDYQGSLEDFVQYFVDDNLLYGPYWLHVKEAWEKRNHPNLHIVFFEDLKTNTMEELRKLNTFLNTHLTEKHLENIAKYTSFSEMKARYEEDKEKRLKDLSTIPESKAKEKHVIRQGIIQKEGGLFRKGEVGDWKGKLTPELKAKVDQYIQNNLTSFKYGI